jgi:hypothetical protein
LKKLIVIIAVVLSMAAVIVSKLHWDDKIAAKASVDTKSYVKDSSLDENKSSSEEKERLKKLTGNLDKAIAEKIKEAIDKEEQLHLVIFGSASTPLINGWPSLVKEELLNAYGDAVLRVTIKEIANKNSSEVINEGLYKSVIDSSPDLLLYEPFFLYDNDQFAVNKRLENLEYVIGEFEKANPDLITIIQPANPLHNATYYPGQVDELKEYALGNDILYIDHWSAWPDQTSKEMLDYVNGSGLPRSGQPTEKGHQVWAEYLTEYFIANTDEAE